VKNLICVFSKQNDLIREYTDDIKNLPQYSDQWPCPNNSSGQLQKSVSESSDSCSESDSEGLSTAQLSENEGSFKSNNELWTVKEVQTLKRCASMVKNGEASWEDVAAALNSTGSERTIIAVRCCFTCCPSATR
jgi:hypothetical protein